MRPTRSKPLTWHLESLEQRFQEFDITEDGILRALTGQRGVTAELPAAGPVRVTVTGQVGPPIVTTVNLKDYLVVSIGDSYASGQGNPDQNGVPTVGSSAICELTTIVALVTTLHDELKGLPVIGDFVAVAEDLIEEGVDLLPFLGGADDLVHMDPPPVWLEPLAWRSLRSSPSLAAQAAELKGRGRLTTFVSVAQSGAEIEAGLLKPQRPFRPVGQIDEVFELLRDPRDKRRNPRLLRPIDVLMMSVGGNDAGFSGALSDMTTEKIVIGMLWETGATQGEIRARVRAKLKKLPGQYDMLAQKINDRLDPKTVLITEYPTALFDGSNGKPSAGCGLFDFTGPAGVSASDAALIESVGNRLNELIREAATRNGWTVVTGVAEDFKRHGYCSRQPFFVAAEESCNRQDDLEGTMHPNRVGTAAVARRLGLELTRILNALDNDATAGVRRPPRRPAAAGRQRLPRGAAASRRRRAASRSR